MSSPFCVFDKKSLNTYWQRVQNVVLYTSIYFMCSLYLYAKARFWCTKHTFQKIRRLISATAECWEPDSSSTSHFERPRIQQNFIRRLIEVVTTRRSWKFVGQAEAKVPKPLENTDYFGTPKIAKTRISNVISNTFKNHNLIRRNIEAVTTRRSWKPARRSSFCSLKILVISRVFGIFLNTKNS